MGEAKRRKAEIEMLKHAAPEDAMRWQRIKQDEKGVARGIDPKSTNPESTAAMARLLHTMFERAKQDGNVDPPVMFLQSKLDATVQGFGDLPIACKRGCSHCCYTWVSVTAPEALFISKIVKLRGDRAIDRVRTAHQHTKDYNFDTRPQHPQPCPLLEQDTCSIYDTRPKACRMAASNDAAICARAYHGLSNEGIPTPALYLLGRTVYSVAMASALRKANLPYHVYEFNAALIRAIDTDNAERVWLSGQDIFSGVMREPGDTFSETPAQMMYQHAFG
jgi:Fe-S-cluster containining protein